MKSCYVDIHIHTSENADHLDSSYDVAKLKRNIELISNGNPYLVSLTDHNVINVNAYQALFELDVNFVIGVEAHVRNYHDCPPYHCHLIFNIPDDIRKDKEKLSEELRNINLLLAELYPKKMIGDTDNIPSIHDIITKFVDYDLLVLPHGGQSHSTFDKSIRSNEKDRHFDSVLERSLYYNLFDGFTSRSDKGLHDTIEYFKKLGINEFINLITCSDNYDVAFYPSDKNKNNDFVPTWMYSSPTFSGLRIALSEKSRLHYGTEPADDWQEKIISSSLETEQIDMKVNFEPGLNVIIGNSSSGKTLLVDSIVHKIKGTMEKCEYSKSFDLSKMVVNNPSGIHPHYFSQNYILQMIKPTIDDRPNSLGENELLKMIFPLDISFQREITTNLKKLSDELNKLIKSVENIDTLSTQINAIQSFCRLISLKNDVVNPLKPFKITQKEIEKINIRDSEFEDNSKKIDEIFAFSKKLAFCESIEKEIESITTKFNGASKEINFANQINNIIDGLIKSLDDSINAHDEESKQIAENKKNLISAVSSYVSNLENFEKSLTSLTSFNFSIKTKEIQSSGHTLYISNKLTITKEILLASFNKYLKSGEKINSIDDLSPSKLFSSHFSRKSPKIIDYEDFLSKILNDISGENHMSYDIKHKNGKDFNELSPGLKASVILDIILGYDKDNAPLVIDQPEDNLATSYINHDLIDSIKKCKKSRQIIIVSHNATIPMLGDAQNIIVCTNDPKITIRSFKMEDNFDSKTTILDIIANITDGGKSSIKKRFKKYNMKSYKGEQNEN